MAWRQIDDKSWYKPTSMAQFTDTYKKSVYETFGHDELMSCFNGSPPTTNHTDFKNTQTAIA